MVVDQTTATRWVLGDKTGAPMRLLCEGSMSRPIGKCLLVLVYLFAVWLIVYKTVLWFLGAA